MKTPKHSKIILGFAAGLLMGIFVEKSFFTKKNKISSQAQTAHPACPDPTQKIVEEKKALPIVKLDDGTFPPPEFAPDMPKNFESRHPGEFRVRWIASPGAAKVRVKIVDKKNNIKQTYSTSKDLVYAQRIPWDGSDDPFTNYRVFLVSLNEAGVEGPPGQMRPLKLYKEHAFFPTDKKASQLAAPEIKSIVTED